MKKIVVLLVVLTFLIGLTSCQQIVEKAKETAKEKNITTESIQEALEKAMTSGKKTTKEEEEPKEPIEFIEEKKEMPEVPEDKTTGSEYERFKGYLLETTCLKLIGQQESMNAELSVVYKYGFKAEEIEPLFKKYPDATKDIGKRVGTECAGIVKSAMPKDAIALQDLLLEITCKTMAGRIKTKEEQLPILTKYGYSPETFKAAVEANPEAKQGLAPRLLECPEFLDK